ncbi:MAG: septal ring lytic transglycosylase RlpA family protein [Nitrosomonas sp.]
MNSIKLGLCSLIILTMFGCTTVPVQEKSLQDEVSTEKNPIVFHTKREAEIPISQPAIESPNLKDSASISQEHKQVSKKTESPKDELQWPSETGIASYYAADMEGRLTASGERYSPELLTAAHKTIPLGSTVRVTNLRNNQQVVVRINDRWGGGGDRVINLSKQAATELGFGSAGMISVRLNVESLSAQKIVHPVTKVQPLPARIEETDHRDPSRLKFCQNQAEILGLTGDFFKNHIAACMKQKN